MFLRINLLYRIFYGSTSVLYILCETLCNCVVLVSSVTDIFNRCSKFEKIKKFEPRLVWPGVGLLSLSHSPNRLSLDDFDHSVNKQQNIPKIFQIL